MIITDKDLKEKGIQAIKDALQEENVIQFDDNGKMIDFNLIDKEDEFALTEEDILKSYEIFQKEKEAGQLIKIKDIKNYIKNLEKE